MAVLRDRIQAINGSAPFDLVLRNVQIVNVYQDLVQPGDVAIVGDRIAYVGELNFPYTAQREVDGHGSFLLPGFVDSHMHLESSMLMPANFARVALCCGTTTICPDPHEIGNVLGLEGVRSLQKLTEGLPLRVCMMAPSTIPSAPGFEGTGYDVGPEEAARLLALPGVAGLGEVMDFNGVADGDERICSVIQTAADRGCIIDGHASVLTGQRLQAFRAAGIDSDHTTPTAEKLQEELSLGFTVQVQECMLTEEMVRAMNEAKLSNRICLVTDDVPLPHLMHEGHLNHVMEKAIGLGLDPLRAVRFVTINPAERLRLYDVGGIAPGMKADLQMVEDLRHPHPTTVLFEGRFVVEDGRPVFETPKADLPQALFNTVRCDPVKPEDFLPAVSVPQGFLAGTALVNVIAQDSVTVRTKRVQKILPVLWKAGRAELNTAGLVTMAVFNRYGKNRHSLALIDGMEQVKGAVAITYGHDSHNLSVFGSGPDDLALAANTVIKNKGGICAAREGKVTSLIPLPLAGLLSPEKPETLLHALDGFLSECEQIGFRHEKLMSFFTIMPLAVSPEIKCSDLGLIDVVHKQFLPLIEKIEEEK